MDYTKHKFIELPDLQMNNVRPIDEIDDNDHFSQFICKDYPSSCGECLCGWYSICSVSTDEKEKSETNNIRPFECPLIKPSCYLDTRTNKYPGLTEDEWVKRNPIIKSDDFVVSIDRMIDNSPCIKCGDGKTKYTDLPFLSIPNTNNHIIDNAIARLNNIDLMVLFTLCSSEIIRLSSLLCNDKSSTNTVHYQGVKSIEDQIEELQIIKSKLNFNMSHYDTINSINRRNNTKKRKKKQRRN